MNDPDFKTLSDAWIHLSPWQKKIFLWRVLLESIRARAARYVQSLLRRQ